MRVRVTDISIHIFSVYHYERLNISMIFETHSRTMLYVLILITQRH